MITKFEISGFRGFSTTQTLSIPQPNGNAGSGLLTIVGSNSSGKTTISEAFKAFIGNNNPSFSLGRRNLAAGDIVHLKVITSDGDAEIKSISPGSSETEVQDTGGRMSLRNNSFVLQSRRAFNPYFGKAEMSRIDYTQGNSSSIVRSNSLDNFSYRLFSANKNRDKFNELLFKALGYEIDWTMDLTDAGQYYLRITSQGIFHGSEGLGEGVISLFFIIDALYDSKHGDCILIDEPELSLHPAIQRRLFSILKAESANKQIILCTHSPYFLDLSALEFGGSIARVVKSNNMSVIYQLNDPGKILGMMKNINNPHIFGLEAREIFFADDNIILTEGQEDVLYYRKLQRELGFSIGENFYGWGVGGASNMKIICTLLQDLGYRKVVGILDGDKQIDYDTMVAQFASYSYFILPVDDIRDKEEVLAKPAVIGLLDSKRTLKPEYKQFAEEIFNEISTYFKK